MSGCNRTQIRVTDRTGCTSNSQILTFLLTFPFSFLLYLLLPFLPLSSSFPSSLFPSVLSPLSPPLPSLPFPPPLLPPFPLPPPPSPSPSPPPPLLPPLPSFLILSPSLLPPLDICSFRVGDSTTSDFRRGGQGPTPPRWIPPVKNPTPLVDNPFVIHSLGSIEPQVGTCSRKLRDSETRGDVLPYKCSRGENYRESGVLLDYSIRNKWG